MNNLLYNARMALRDFMEINIFTKGTDRVYLSLDPDLTWEGAVPEGASEQDGRAHTEKVVLTIVDRLQEMDMVLAGGESAVSALLEAESVEILRKAA
ncbi:hypothetical protein ACIRU3_44420 [Streptomyces sp. NPDC101151]|uniref:hypothetical protein n=1 Tax=Streptomyces sp. NPDC101151 TaxID=3366115 RepID=UPI00382FFEE6